MTQSNESGSGQSGAAPEGTLISIILDRSGSMASLRGPTISGFNQFIRDQRSQGDGGRALVSLTQFNHRYEVNFVGEPIENLPDLDGESYIPTGNTALYDAIGRTIHELEAWTHANGWKERVLVLIITDGQENSSVEYSFAQIQALIKRKEEENDWNFVYMGANQDAYAVGGAMNVRRSYNANWDASAGGVADAYERMSVGARSYRAGTLKGVHAHAFFDDAEEGKKAEKPKQATGKMSPKGSKGDAGR